MNYRLDKLAVAAVVLASMAAALVPAFAADTSAQDAALASSVKSALVQLPEFHDKTTEIVVSAREGKVNLSGWVVYANDVEAAEKAAARIEGVKGVTANVRSWSTNDRQ